jgi:signal-transduction protein with cAMP-binding, CBS, and nucleotidyltransferase domain
MKQFVSLYNFIYFKEDFHHGIQQKMMSMLRAIPILAGWRDENLEGLIRQMKVSSFVRKDVVYDIGDPTDHLFIVKSGEIEVQTL